MKIGILTFWNSSDNYGQLLQLYASEQILIKRGHEPYALKFDKGYALKKSLKYKIKSFWPIRLLRYIFNSSYRKVKINEKNNKYRQFDKFRNEKIIFGKEYYKSLSDLRKFCPKYDAVIVGSDQVWNFSWYSDKIEKIDTFFLNFLNESRKVAFACSFGKNNIDDIDCKEKIKQLLEKFDYVSVREESGVDICKKMGISAEWICDPTLHLTINDYRELYNSASVKKYTDRKYILFYYLNNGCNFNIDEVYDFANKKNLELLYVSGNGCLDDRKKIYPTIEEWLYLIDNAEYVITNSFHCCVFSCIFEKKFGVISLSGKSKGMNSRIDSLFRICNIKERYILENDFSSLEKDVEQIKISDKNFINRYFDNLK